MPVREQMLRLVGGLSTLGTRRLILLALIGLTVFFVVGFSGFYMTRPAYETLYAGLDTQDVTRIGAALNEAGIRYDISPDGKTVKVLIGKTARARMLLAEKGLPRSANAGYELFDNLGSLGLTSFMQELTRVRALEGEIARTIQLMAGVKAARVHLVMPDPGSFRSSRQPPSASVVIRTAHGASFEAAPAIRHLVAAAIPGLRVDRVTVMNTEGTLLALGGDSISAAPRKMVDLQRTVGNQIQDNIRKTLTPFLGLGNFQTSVAVRINTDKKNIKEVIFDPESKVERSVRVVREKGDAKNQSSSSATSVQQDIPAEPDQPSTGGESSEAKERREKLTNYEITSKTVSTEKTGYAIENLAIAVVVNRSRVQEILGKDADAQKLSEQLEDIRQLAVSAAGFSEKRGDTIKVTAIEFVDSKALLAPAKEAGFMQMVQQHVSTLIAAFGLIVAAFLVTWFGLRPAVRVLAAPRLDAGEQSGSTSPAGAPAQLASPENAAPNIDAGEAANLIGDLVGKTRNLPQKRLQQMIDVDEAQAITIMKRWAREEVAA